MHLPSAIARHLREVFFGGNWTCSSVKEHLTDVTWQQAITPVTGFNTIAALAFHINYFVEAVLPVLKGGKLTANDKFSFDCPVIQSQQDWESLLTKMYRNVEELALLIEQLPEIQLGETFVEKKYGTWYRNLHGIIEHSHYHLGQIVILKKLVLKQ